MSFQTVLTLSAFLGSPRRLSSCSLWWRCPCSSAGSCWTYPPLRFPRSPPAGTQIYLSHKATHRILFANILIQMTLVLCPFVLSLFPLTLLLNLRSVILGLTPFGWLPTRTKLTEQNKTGLLSLSVTVRSPLVSDCMVYLLLRQSFFFLFCLQTTHLVEK